MNNSHVLSGLASIVFVLHIIGNLFFTRPTPEAINRLNKLRELSLFPPDWVFGIWIVIWALQSAMLIQTFGSPFWTRSTTLLFILVCAGNLGSQMAGAKNLPWFVYLMCLGLMLFAALGFMLHTTANSLMMGTGVWGSQLYVGWASLAFLVGLGVILVCLKSVVSDHSFTVVGLALTVVVPVAIWIAWGIGKFDYRIVSIPYIMLIVALGLRKLSTTY